MIRVDVATPPPHGTLHWPHALHGPTWQSTGHGCELHAWVMVVAGQAAPPWATGVTTLAVCDCVPPPHGTEQGPNADQALMTQSTGQG